MRGQDTVISGWDKWCLPHFSQFELLETSVSCFISSEVLPCGRLQPRGPAGRDCFSSHSRACPHLHLRSSLQPVSYRSPQPAVRETHAFPSRVQPWPLGGACGCEDAKDPTLLVAEAPSQRGLSIRMWKDHSGAKGS